MDSRLCLTAITIFGIIDDMEIRVLKYFLAVAREGSITKAANFLHLTQPTLSRQLKEFEKELGQQLLIRTNHNVYLTQEGMILRKRAEEILELVEKTEGELSSIKDSIAGEVYIGSGETDALKAVTKVIQAIRKEHPQIVFHITSGIFEDVIEKLDRGLLDFGIVMQPCDLSKYDYHPLPDKDLWGIVMRKDSHLAEKDFITLADLENVPLILSKKAFRKQNENNEFYRWFNKNKDKLNIAATHNLFFNAALLAEDGIGYVFTLNNLVNTSKTSTLCFKPLRPSFEASWNIIWKKHQIFSPAAKLFLEKIKESIEIL